MTNSTTKLGNVLVIDDDKISNFIYTRVVTASGVADHVKSCMSGQESLTYLKDVIANKQSLFPDLIFLDINMPVMNGWEFLEEYINLIPGDFQDNAVLCILSSSVYKEDIDKAHSYPQVKEYVPKPLTADGFQKLIEKFF